MKCGRIIWCVLLLPLWVKAQNYSATNGSSYLGSLNVHNNPAAIVNNPYRWDLTILGIQDKHTTNAIEIRNYSLLSNPALSEYLITEGRFKRHGDFSVQVNLLNTRIALSKKNAIAFGANIRAYGNARTSPYNFTDTLRRFGTFFSQNEETGTMNMDMSSSAWAELYAGYAHTILDNPYARLNAGVTFRLNRGLTGAFASLREGRFTTDHSTDPAAYNVVQGALDFGYSAPLDYWDSDRSFSANRNEFLRHTETGGSLDIGVEYLVKWPGASGSRADEGYYDYNWKIGVAVMDIGYAQYKYGRHSTRARNIRPGVTDLVLDGSLDSTITNLGQLKDSLSAVFSSIGTYSGKFRVAHPTRLVLNVDKFLQDAFFVNAELVVNLNTLSHGSGRYVNEMALLTITPRWELSKKGFYLPMYFNNHGRFWVGGAVRFGPILLGLHNWSNLFSKKKMHQGGGYLALIISPGKILGEKPDHRLNCPQ